MRVRYTSRGNVEERQEYCRKTISWRSCQSVDLHRNPRLGRQFARTRGIIESYNLLFNFLLKQNFFVYSLLLGRYKRNGIL